MAKRKPASPNLQNAKDAPITEPSKKIRAFEVSSLWNVTKLVPLVAVFAYVAGYVVNMSYLDTLGIRYASFVNSTFFKSGFLVLALFAPATFLVYSNFPEATDDLSKSVKSLPFAFGIPAVYSVMISFFFTLLVAPNEIVRASRLQPFAVAILVLFFLSIMSLFYVTSYAARNLTRLARGLIFLLPTLLLYILSIQFTPQATKTLLILFGYDILLSHVFIGTYGDKELNLAAPFLALVFVTIGCFFFGRQVYSSIPQYFGGMRPYIISLTVKPSYAETFKAVGFRLTRSVQVKNAKIAYEDTDSYVLDVGNGYYSVSKDAFLGAYSTPLVGNSRPSFSLPDTADNFSFQGFR